MLGHCFCVIGLFWVSSFLLSGHNFVHYNDLVEGNVYFGMNKKYKKKLERERESKYEYWGIVCFDTIFDNHPVTFWYKTALSHIEGN